MIAKGKAKPRTELDEEPNFNCKLCDQWSENDGEDMFWECKKGILSEEAIKANCCPTNCPGFELRRLTAMGNCPKCRRASFSGVAETRSGRVVLECRFCGYVEIQPRAEVEKR